MQASHHFRPRRLVRAEEGTTGILLGLIIFGTCFAGYRIGKLGNAISDIPIIIAFFFAISSSTAVPYRDVWASKLKPMLAALYVYVLVCLLPLASGGGFVWFQLAKDLFSFSMFPITVVTLAKVVKAHRINRVVKIGLILSTLTVCISVVTSPGARTAGILVSPNLGGNWAAGLIVLLLVLEIPKNLVGRIALIALLASASLRMASLGGILCVLVSVAYWLPRRSQNLTIAKQVLPFVIGIFAPSILQAFDGLTGLNRYTRSSNGRLSIWNDAFHTWLERPLGLGIGNFADPDLQVAASPEAHNDYLSSLVELGLLGPLALGGICLSMAALGGLRTRTMVVFYLASALSHNSINFRHIWVFTAICFAYDILPQLQPKAESKADNLPEHLTQDVQMYRLRRR